MTTADPTPESTTTSAAATSERSTISADDIAARARDIAATTAQRTWTGFSSLSRPQQVLVVLGHLLFWPFNLFFGSTAVLGYMPIVLLDLLLDAFAGLVPWAFAIGAVLLAAVPLASIVGGIVLALRRDGRALLTLLFGVEVPALWLLMSRTFGMQELSGAASTLIVGATLGLAALYARVIDTSSSSSSWSDRRTLATQPLIALLVPIAVFVVVVFGGLALPAFVDLVADLIGSVFRNPQYFSPLAPIFFVIVFGFFAAPFIGPIVWVGALFDGARTLRRLRGIGIAAALSIGPAVAFVVVVASQWASPAEITLARFATPPANDDERRALLADKEAIRAGLVDAALLTHRYPFGNGHPWREAWRAVVGEAAATIIDDELRLWAAPFVYDGDIHADPSRAQQLYRDFFGDELERVERDAVKKAMSSTFTREQRFAGLINQGEQRVRLVNQSVTATPTDHGTIVVEIHDEWSNLTPTDLEIQLMFSLPPTAAVTGLWLNDVDDKKLAFPLRSRRAAPHSRCTASRCSAASIPRCSSRSVRSSTACGCFPCRRVPSTATDAASSASRAMPGRRRRASTPTSGSPTRPSPLTARCRCRRCSKRATPSSTTSPPAACRARASPTTTRSGCRARRTSRHQRRRRRRSSSPTTAASTSRPPRRRPSTSARGAASASTSSSIARWRWMRCVIRFLPR